MEGNMQTDKRREYDRLRQRRLYQEFRDLKDHVCLDIMGGECYLCGRTDNANEYHLHHVEYHPTESAYPKNAKSQWARVKRAREAEAHPERFRLLCPKCHWDLEKVIRIVGTKDWDMTRFKEIIDLESTLDRV